MNREKGLAYCGLACCVCGENETCAGCRNAGCKNKEWCKHFNCCKEKGLNGCWECGEFPCGGMHDKVRVLAFAKYIQQNGEEKMLDCLERNEKAGVVYHYQGQFIGDYDKCAIVDDVIEMLDKKSNMSFDEFLSFRNVEIRNKDHNRIVRMFYPHLTSVCGVPEALSRLIGEIIGVDFSGASIITGCFNGTNDGIAAPYGTPDLYCKWDNGIHVHVYGTLPKSNFTALQPNEYVLFALSDQITTNVERTADHHIYMRCAQ